MIRISATLVVCCFAFVADVSAQGPPRQMPESTLRNRAYLGFGTMPALYTKDVLIARPSVQEEIGLTQLQMEKLKRVDANARQFREHTNFSGDYDRAFQELHAKHAGPEELQALTRRYAAELGALRAEAELVKYKVLEHGQRDRLDEIQLQAQGPIAFTRPDIQERLNMSPEQVELIGTIVAEGREEMIRESAFSPEVGQAYFEKRAARQLDVLEKSKSYQDEIERGRNVIQATRGRTMQRIAKVLSKKQWATYVRMLGKPFNLGTMRVASKSATVESEREAKGGEAKGKTKSKAAR